MPAVQCADATELAVSNREAGFSAMQGLVNITQHGHDTKECITGTSGVKSKEKSNLHRMGAGRRVAGAADGQRRAKSQKLFRYSHSDKGKSQQGSGPS